MLDESPWLSPHSHADVELNTSLLAEVLREFRRDHHINQADLAQMLHLDQSYVSKIETGKRRVTDVEMLLRIAQQLDIPPQRLGLSDDMLRPIPAPSNSPLVGDIDPVAASQERWRRTRRILGGGRHDLARLAAKLYRPDVRVGELPFLTRPEWMPAAPVPLHDVRLEWVDDPAPVMVTGGEPEAGETLPLRAPGRRFSRYSAAMRYLSPPKLFDNRTSYRLFGLDLRADPRMRFGLATYFDKIDLGQALAHELALANAASGYSAQPPPWDVLPLRALVGDPFDLHRRYMMPSVGTLTLRRDRATGRATFPLHWRDPAKVVGSAGVYSLIPGGEFQPSTVATHDRANDFDLWRNIVREYSEELLGDPERDGSSGQPLDYESWPFYRAMQDGRAEGRIRPYCLGFGLDALTLSPAILTAVVFDDDIFDGLFGASVQVNAEGTLVLAAGATSVSEGVPFTEDSVRRLLDDEPLGSSSACTLDRAHRFREELLAPH